MNEQHPSNRFMVIVKEGAPHGDLYELEHAVYYNIVDRDAGHVIMTFQGKMETTLSRTRGGMWENYRPWSSFRPLRVFKLFQSGT